ncbi:MAG: hypothetical protein ACREE7_18425, partial [Dongiaceae bacterium]
MLHEVGGGGHGTAADVTGRSAIRYSIGGRSHQADLYSTGTPAAAIVLVPGLAPEGKDDPRLVQLAGALARARFAVLVPDIASLRAQRVSPANVREIADALTHVATWEVTPADRPRGVAAISYAVGPAMLATLEPDQRGEVDFLVGIGGYRDVASVVTYFTTGYSRDPGSGDWLQGQPNEYGKWLFVAANAVRVEDLRDRTSLTAMAGRRMRDPAADIGDLAALLGPEGRAVHSLLANGDPALTPALIAELPRGLREDLAALDLRDRDLSGAPRQVILVHGRDDRIVPVGESIALAATLPEGSARLYLADRLAHANLEPGG